jgi:DNA polymerase-3 subunit gamma/tau
MISLARKYRPKVLADLLGQETLLRVLGAAIDHDRIAPAYVLTGIRGVGKTTTARIIARAINCAKGPTLTPCGVCASCQAIDSDSAMDVIEIDGASNNGIDAVRDLIANVAYAPMTPGGRKIYIIDEAHMLSTSAWNGLLKTLEEPPAHVMFIFATTEMRKIPATILSRCQTLRLNRIDLKTLEQHLDTVSAKESVPLEPGARALLARAAEGSMRDALSMLDQAISAQPTGVTTEAVLDMLGRASRMATGDLARTVVAGDLGPMLETWKTLLMAGHDGPQLLEDVITWIHQAQLHRLAKGYVASMALPEGEKSLLDSLSQGASPGAFQGCANFLLDALALAKDAPNPLLAVEMALVRATNKFASLKKG